MISIHGFRPNISNYKNLSNDEIWEKIEELKKDEEIQIKYEQEQEKRNIENFEKKIKELINMGYDETMPEWMRERARARSVELLTHPRQEQQAQQQLATMSDTDLGKALLKKTTDGSWLKYLALKHVGLTDLAEQEGAKLGIGKETYATLNNQPVSLKLSNNGTPIDGFNAITGKKLTPNELVQAAQGAVVQKGAQTHTGKMQDIRTNEVYYERTTPQGIELEIGRAHV